MDQRISSDVLQMAGRNVLLGSFHSSLSTFMPFMPLPYVFVECSYILLWISDQMHFCLSLSERDKIHTF